MNNKLQWIVIAGLGIGCVALAFLLASHKKELPVIEQKLVGSSTQTRASYDVIGTGANSSTLTAQYSGNSRILNVGYLENLHLDIRYTPLTGQTNRYAEILIEGSNDGGVNYFPISSKVVGTDEIDLYVTSTADGLPLGIVIPGTKISIGSTTYAGQYDQDIVADHIRVSARESGTGNNGFIYVRMTATSKE